MASQMGNICDSMNDVNKDDDFVIFVDMKGMGSILNY
jgi:hypothetical protein